MVYTGIFFFEERVRVTKNAPFRQYDYNPTEYLRQTRGPRLIFLRPAGTNINEQLSTNNNKKMI